MKIQTVILALAGFLTACPLPLEGPMGDEASDDTDTTDDADTTDGATEDTSETESSESGTIEFPEPTDSGVVDESTDESTDDLAEESSDTMDLPDMPMEEWGCCVCSADGFAPICLPPQSATGVACGELGDWAGMHAIWVPCVTTPEGVVCELDCGS